MVTTWDKLWPPEIDWMDPYLNLSTFPNRIINALIAGDQMKTKFLYRSEPKWGRFVTYYFSSDHANAYYLEHYANRNETLYLCFPHFPRLDLVKEYIAAGNKIARYFKYKENMFDGWTKEQEGEWSYIWSTYGGTRLVVALSAVGIIGLVGTIGKWVFSLCRQIYFLGRKQYFLLGGW